MYLLILVKSGHLQTDVIKSLVMRINISIFPSAPEISTASSLAHQGLLDSVKDMYLKDVDLSSVPAEHLASLAACVTELVYINKVRNCDIISILDSAKCEELWISNQSLSREETQALVRIMESHVKEVWLDCKEEVSLDITTLTQYNGQGKCEWVNFFDDTTANTYCEEVKTWARRINWKFVNLNGNFIVLFKPHLNFESHL